MANETEKLTINLGVVELAQIDVLVEQGVFSNRSDFMRTAIRKELDVYGDRMEIAPILTSGKDNWTKTVGILSISKKMLEKLAGDGERINISVIGMLLIDAGVSAQLFKQTVDTVLIRGKVIAPDEIKAHIKEQASGN